ncbi:MAG: hypothetical protein ACHQ2E_04505 [Gemmatimonadales bacterium]
MPTIILKESPDHHDAELVIRLYELRREAVMRESRHALATQFWPRNAEDVLALTRADHPLNAAWRQVGGYWEMVYGMARHGIVHADFLVDNNGEGLMLFAKVEPYLDALRAEAGPRAFRNAEWVARETEMGRTIAERFRGRIAARLKAAK